MKGETTGTDNPIREDDESQPHKGKGGQSELPGVLENVVQLPELTRAIARLAELRAGYAEIGKKTGKQRLRCLEIMKAHNIPTYIDAGLKLEIIEGEDELKVTTYTPPEAKAEKPEKKRDKKTKAH